MTELPAAPNTDANRRPPPLFTTCAAIFAIALVLRVVYAYTRPVPVSVDAAYYLMVADNLYHGRGLVADYVWNYLAGLPAGLPVPSNEYWMPGQSVVVAAAFALARDVSLRAAQWPGLILGAFLCAITAWIAGVLTRRRDVALLAGGAAAFNYYLVELALFPDHFMLNAVLVNLSLLALWSAWRGAPSLGLLAGALAALAYLTRTDGALLLAVPLVLAFGFRRRARDTHATRMAVYFIVAFAVIAAPWWVRQTLVFGSPSGANPLRTAFLTSYNDLFRLDHSHLNLRDYLQESQTVAFGVKGYVLFRDLRLLAKAVMLFGVLAVAALFWRNQRREAVPWLIYLPLALLVPAFLVPFPAVKGGLWHILPALTPALFALGAGAAIAIFEAAPRVKLGALRWLTILAAFGSLGYWWARPPTDAGQAAEPVYPLTAIQAVRDLGPSPQPALTDDAWGLYDVARIPCAQFPMDGVDAALQVADAIGAGYLITRANATNQIPAMSEVVRHPRFQPLARYPAGDTSLLVYRIMPRAPPSPQSRSDSRRRISQ